MTQYWQAIRGAHGPNVSEWGSTRPASAESNVECPVAQGHDLFGPLFKFCLTSAEGVTTTEHDSKIHSPCLHRELTQGVRSTKQKKQAVCTTRHVFQIQWA
eukprot:6486219-Amphidinium_carterae.2